MEGASMVSLLEVVVVSMSFLSNYGTEANGNLQGERRANDTLLIVVDSSFTLSLDEQLESKIRNTVEEIANRVLKKGAVNINYLSNTDFQFNADVTAVFSVSSCDDLWTMFRKGSKYNILFISLTEPRCPRLPPNAGTTMPISVRGFEVPQIILDLRNEGHLEWTSAAVILDETVDENVIQSMVHVLNRPIPSRDFSSCSVVLYKLESMTNETQFKKKQGTNNLLLELPSIDVVKNFLVLVHPRKMPSIIELAKNLELINPSTQWLFVVHNHNSKKGIRSGKVFIDLISEGENMVFLINSTDPELQCNGGLHCNAQQLIEKTLVAIEKSIEQEMILADSLSDEEWEVLKPTKDERRSNILEYLTKRHRDEIADCDSCTEWRIKSSDSWGLDFMLEPPKQQNGYRQREESTDSGKLLEVGIWQPRTGAVLVDHLYPNVKGGFRGRKMPVASLHYPPWQFVDYNDYGQPSGYRGVVFDILNELATKMNFTYEIILLPNGTNANNNSVAKFSEVLGEIVLDSSVEYAAWDHVVTGLQSKKIFLGAIGFAINEGRKTKVNFTLPLAVEPYGFLVARPKVLSRVLLFIQPFTNETWLCILATILLSGPLLYFVHRVTPFYEHYSHRGKGGYTKLYNCFWYLYGALLQQGGGVMPEADSGRLVIGTWWLVVLVIVTTYSGSLVAFLTFPKMDKVISNVDQLFERSAVTGKGTLTWSFPMISTIHELLKVTDNKQFNLLHNAGEKIDQLTPDIIDKIRNGEHVYIQRRSMLLYIMKKEYLRTHLCEFSIGAEDVLDERLGLVTAINSPYLKIINKHIHEMHKVGLIGKWMEDSSPQKDECSMSSLSPASSTHTVNLDDMQGCFFLLLMGIAAAIILMIGEIACSWWIKRKRKSVIEPFIS